jgi:hypothetical protein
VGIYQKNTTKQLTPWEVRILSQTLIQTIASDVINPETWS